MSSATLAATHHAIIGDDTSITLVVNSGKSTLRPTTTLLASMTRTIPITKIELKFDIGANFHFFATRFRKGTFYYFWLSSSINSVLWIWPSTLHTHTIQNGFFNSSSRSRKTRCTPGPTSQVLRRITNNTVSTQRPEEEEAAQKRRGFWRPISGPANPRRED